MDSILSLKRHTWKIYQKNHRLINCTEGPRRIPDRNVDGYLPKTQTIFYELILVKSQRLRIPPEIKFFMEYQAFVSYSVTLFDNNKKEFFGRTYTTNNIPCTISEDNDDVLLESHGEESLYFHVHDVDVDDTFLIIQLLINCQNTDPQIFSLGFYVIDLTNVNNVTTLVLNESPRVLSTEEGAIYLTEHRKPTESELIFSIDTKSDLLPVKQIIPENTIY